MREIEVVFLTLISDPDLVALSNSGVTRVKPLLNGNQSVNDCADGSRIRLADLRGTSPRLLSSALKFSLPSLGISACIPTRSRSACSGGQKDGATVSTML